ncbi:MAG: monovalent cation/H+ antiporter subunit D family protein [Candidatus Binatia bacterium]
MEVVHSIRPALAILVSVVAAFLILTSDRHPNIRELWTLLAAVIKFALVASLLPTVMEGKVAEFTFLEILPGLPLRLRVDSFGLYFALVASGLWIFTSLYSIGYMRGLKEHAQTRYFFSFALCLSATIGIAFAGNLLTFFVFYEMLSMATYPLVVHRETPEAVMAGRKYLAYLLTAGVFLLFSIGWAYSLVGNLDFVPGGFLAGHASKEVLQILFVTFMLGVGAKASIMPIHAWLPTAMIAPTPVSALLHAVAVVKAGVFGSVRVVCYVFGPSLLKEIDMGIVLAYFGAFTILVASMFALAEDNLKRRLAFSTISQLSYIILGAALISPNSLTGGILHIANHAYMKITLFFTAGAIYVKTHVENISQMDGIGRQMPLTMGAFTVGALGMAGIPPVSGFLSKWYLVLGTLEAHEVVFLVVLLLSAILNIAYFFPVVFRAFFRSSDRFTSMDDASPFMVVPLVITAITSVVLGLAPNAVLNLLHLTRMSVENILGAG